MVVRAKLGFYRALPSGSQASRNGKRSFDSFDEYFSGNVDSSTLSTSPAELIASRSEGLRGVEYAIRQYKAQREEMKALVGRIYETQRSIDCVVSTGGLVNRVISFLFGSSDVPDIDELFLSQKANLESFLDFGSQVVSALDEQRDLLFRIKQGLVRACERQDRLYENQLKVVNSLPDYKSLSQRIGSIRNSSVDYNDLNHVLELKKRSQDVSLAASVIGGAAAYDKEALVVIDRKENQVFDALKETAHSVLHARKALQVLESILGSDLTLLVGSDLRNHLRSNNNLMSKEVRALVSGLEGR